MTNNLKHVEAQTLSTFRKHRPSEYFSHLGTGESFAAHDGKVERLYRFGLTVPPEFFNGRTLVDLGAGTGEHTISLARWGAKCTLVEMNSDAVAVAKGVFSTHAPRFEDHTFINSSLYDIDLDAMRGNFDISHSRGVFTHVADKARAFRILVALAKPGGYVIYGDRNTCGGVQEMLQRYAIYKLGGEDDARIVDIAEALFKEDIDRSQATLPRTREAIIFDRWVIQQQDDPSVDDVLTMFETEGVEYVNSWPRIDYVGRGTSTFSDPRNPVVLRRGARLAENLWMILNHGEAENVDSQLGEAGADEYFSGLARVAGSLRNVQIGTPLEAGDLRAQFTGVRASGEVTFGSALGVARRLRTFFSEVDEFLSMIETGQSLEVMRRNIDGFEILFKGFAGVRHVDYVAYKPLQAK